VVGRSVLSSRSRGGRAISPCSILPSIASSGAAISLASGVEDVAPHGHAVERGTVRQKKIGRTVRFEMTEQTREALDGYINATGTKPADFLFVGRRRGDRGMTTRQYARLVATWIASIGLDPKLFGTHSLRRTRSPCGRGWRGGAIAKPRRVRGTSAFDSSYPAPGSLLARARNDPSSPTRGEGGGVCRSIGRLRPNMRHGVASCYHAQKSGT
jgi:hypothetical protein